MREKSQIFNEILLNLTICRLNQNEIPDCIKLVKEVYDEFVGIDYSDKGNKTFYSIIDPPKVAERLANGNLIICCKLHGKIVGMEELRDKNHIALFFVKKEHQGKGIGRRLFDFSIEEIRKNHPSIKEVTVNSSLYAQDIYTRLGFIKVSEMQEKDGIKYIPMKYTILD